MNISSFFHHETLRPISNSYDFKRPGYYGALPSGKPVKPVKHKDLTIICGHYGCGKTNLSINLALDAAAAGGRVTLVDFDIVNPYFRTSDYTDMLNSKGINVIAPSFARTTLDLPVMPREVQSIFGGDGIAIIDAGGDDAGATVLGRYAEEIMAGDYDMLYVINRYRALSTTAEEAVALLREIEQASHLRATAIVNNSHLMRDSTPETIYGALAYADAVAAATGLPLRATVVPGFLREQLKGYTDRPDSLPGSLPEIYPVGVYVRPPWTDEG